MHGYVLAFEMKAFFFHFPFGLDSCRPPRFFSTSIIQLVCGGEDLFFSVPLVAAGRITSFASHAASF